jgi:hypothetical protein
VADLTRYVLIPRDAAAGRPDAVIWENAAWGRQALYCFAGDYTPNVFFSEGIGLVRSEVAAVTLPGETCAIIYETYALQQRASRAREDTDALMYSHIGVLALAPTLRSATTDAVVVSAIAVSK